MRFAWDPKKATANAAKHGLTFAQAITAFDDPFALVASDVAHSTPEEERWWLIVNRKERRRYDESKGLSF